MPRDLAIADHCRQLGLRVVEVAGWQTRGSSTFNGRGSVNHHTAGGSRGTCPSLGGVINGFHGSAPGPLANALQSRETNGDDIIYVVASGKANHAGLGGWRGLSGNSSVYGLEIEHTGREPLPINRQKIAARFHAAMSLGRFDETMVCQHYEWAPKRKIDAATGVNGLQFRSFVAEVRGTPSPPVPEEDDMAKQIMVTKQGDPSGAIWLTGADGLTRKWIPSQELVNLFKFFGISGPTQMPAYWFDFMLDAGQFQTYNGTAEVLRSEGVSGPNLKVRQDAAVKILK
jgi:hypothetical protein